MFCFVGHKYPGLSFDGTFFHDLLGKSMAASNNDVQDLYLDPVFQAFSMGIGINDPDRMDRVNPPFLFFEFENMSCFLRRDIVSICLNTSGIPLTFNGDVKAEPSANSS
jgi:hypothetical protein